MANTPHPAAPPPATPRAAMPSVDALLESLTLGEKAALVEGHDAWKTAEVERLGIPSLFVTDGPHGVRKVRAATGGFDIADNAVASSFPTASAVAASWNPQNAHAIGAAIGHEAVDLEVDVVLAPGVNITRDPRCGRNFEYFSEDPLISGSFGAAFVDGIQSQGVGTSVKHFAANSNEDYRFVGDSVIDDRALREIYLRAFEHIVKTAQPATVMCAYNRLNGTYCSENHDLLTGILREEWGFEGLVMTDWGATHDRVEGMRAGLDLDMPGNVPHNRSAIIAAVQDGSLPLSALDASVRRVLELVERSRSAQRPTAPHDPEAHRDLARRVAADSAVLLRNEGILPLRSGSSGRIAVIGELFERLRFQGAGSSLVTPPAVSSAKDAFDRRGIAYRYARGYRSLELGRDDSLEREAVEASRDADVILFFGGLGDLEESEGFDRTHLRLGEAQTALLQRLVTTGVPIVFVLHAGAPVELPMLDELAAVLQMHLPGMEGGEATADLLFGEVSPSGKLTQSWPRRLDDVSDIADYDRSPISQYYESIYVGYRFYDRASTDLLFPFGHGLSYTRFRYRDLRIVTDGDVVTATVTVDNVGDRDGAEVVQLYVRNNAGAVFKADKELRAFSKVHIPAGGAADVRLSFALSDLSYWDIAEHDWVLENGEYSVLIAASVADIRLEAPLSVTEGRASRSPYPAVVDRDYATPPASIPASFPALIGRPIPVARQDGRLTMETRLADGRGSLLGRVMYSSVVGRMRKDYERALAMPESIERDARVKNSHFTYRLMPSNSLRSMAMSSNGLFPYHLAAGIAEIAGGHLLRGLRTIITKRTTR